VSLALNDLIVHNGIIQGRLEILDIPFVISVFTSSALMDKDVSKKISKYEGILTPEWKMLKLFGTAPKIKRLHCCKTGSEGSKIDVKYVFKNGCETLIEQFIEGKEVTIGILSGIIQICEINGGKVLSCFLVYFGGKKLMNLAYESKKKIVKDREVVRTKNVKKPK
jgi:D-alanine-D-alanine ligase-like ATP-grasp enzyme